MASVTINNLDKDLKSRLRKRATDNGCSIEEEARNILLAAVGSTPLPQSFASVIRSHFGAENGVDLELPPRERERVPPTLAD